jgi:hypothetical protein
MTNGIHIEPQIKKILILSLKMLSKKKKVSKLRHCVEEGCTGKVLRQCEEHGWLCECCLIDFHSQCKVSGIPDDESIQINLVSNLCFLKDLHFLIENLNFGDNKNRLLDDLAPFIE